MTGWVTMLATTFVLTAEPQIVAEIDQPLRRADRALNFADNCIQDLPDPGQQAALAARQRAAWSVLDLAQGIWGDRFLDVALEEPETRRPRCNSDDVVRALQDVDTALAQAAASIRRHAAPLRDGSWIGPFHLCRDTVESASLATDDLTGRTAVSITLKPVFATMVADITAARVNMRLPLRVDGDILVNVPIVERMQGRSLRITGVTESTLEAARAAITGPC